MEELPVRDARRLALCRAGLLKPEWTGLPTGGRGRGPRARAAAHAIIDRFGYLQLDTISVVGVRSHGLVLLSRLGGLAPELAEDLLRPGEPLFEYWGHAACWMPMSLYPAFEFRRAGFLRRPWWKTAMGDGKVARGLLRRMETDGPLRSRDLGERRGEGGDGVTGWWNWSAAKGALTALWSSGEVAIRERQAFHRVWDLTERVIPEKVRRAPLARDDALRVLLLRALDGHGWATVSTLATTWYLRGVRRDIARVLEELREEGEIAPCALVETGGRRVPGWVRTADLALAARLRRIRPRQDRGVLISPFDPVLWDRARALQLFGFRQVLEIYVPAAKRQYGYYVLPVLAGERLVGRVDLKAERKAGRLRVVSRHYEAGATKEDHAAVAAAITRHADALSLAVEG